ncbi:probable DNA-directed RNA polymerase I subunit RPA43 [Ricinus communis]|uniref:DNA-directed RNA polymerase subunit n=1 Tax=Ricinus communis TaxID=3988 RepID=B9R867_RICCO|nr:probable DNA-directed RNA polymerase I subunit RPA43 [Ricinus communis]XP_048227417.1 probable DNA-directed RNA polymerase I subunit RPA43 [Ricinus communis]EEF52697.1 conserved hypothetical protein [Ricinus communis]|eukprot:XP_025012887.1 probable DNA-directed RNA polymerase I subunit RPA43 [Ricinus communis]
MEGLSISEANLVVYVHPSQSKNVSQAILRELSSLLFKFNENFDGVVLAYAFNAPDKQARILCGVHPYFGVRLQATMLVFSPKPDMLLEGKVVKVTRESIHVIVLGFSSAIITDEDIRDEFRYKRKHGEALYVSRPHKQHVIKVGTMIRFVVKSLDEETLHISGSLVPTHTGSISWLEGDMKNTTTDSGNKKRTQLDGEIEVQEEGTAGGDTYSVNGDHEIKKSKKLRNA